MNTTSRAAERQRVKRYRLHAKPHGFTLIELLVVIAIISILAAILFPVFASALERGRMTNCISNARQIGMGMMQYVQDYDEFFPGACMEEPTSVAPSYPGDRVGYEIQIMPYVKSDGIFTCLDDAAYRVPPAKMLYSGKSMFYDPSYITKALKRSYVYIGQINTNQAAASEPDTNTGVTTYATTGGLGKKETIIDAPSSTIIIGESWIAASSSTDTSNSSWLGCASGSELGGCSVDHFAGRVPGNKTGVNVLPSGCASSAHYSQVPTVGHFGRATYIFADGSAHCLSWAQIRNNDFSMFKLRKPTQTYTP